MCRVNTCLPPPPRPREGGCYKFMRGAGSRDKQMLEKHKQCISKQLARSLCQQRSFNG